MGLDFEFAGKNTKIVLEEKIPMFLLTPFIGQKGIWLSMPIADVMTLMISIPLMLVSMKRLTSKS
jgi:hypothetical protein